MAASYDGSADSILLQRVPPRAKGTVPTLHHLCCEFVMNTVINLENAPSVVSFARTHNVTALLQRSEQFCCDSWRGLTATHTAEELIFCLGADMHAKLTLEYESVDERLRKMNRLGSVVDASPAAAPAASPPPPVAPPAEASARSRPDIVSTPPGGLSQRTPIASAAAPVPAPSAKAAAVAKRFSFGGGGEKCALCNKTVYAAEKMAGVPERGYHVNCFRCATCATKLACHNYERTSDGMLLCKVHFKAHLNANMPAASLVDGGIASGSGPMRYIASEDRNCRRCGKRVYANEQATARSHCDAELQVYHRSCFRCADCNRGPLRPDDWVVEAETGTLLCSVHFAARRSAKNTRSEVQGAIGTTDDASAASGSAADSAAVASCVELA